MLIKKWPLLFVVPIALTSVVFGLGPGPGKEGASGAAHAAQCSTWWTVTGKKVAVRRPAPDRTSATSSSPVVRYLHRGDRIKSCLTTHNRGSSASSYTKCGRHGTDWLIVRGPKGGQVPLACVKRR